MAFRGAPLALLSLGVWRIKERCFTVCQEERLLLTSRLACAEREQWSKLDGGRHPIRPCPAVSSNSGFRSCVPAVLLHGNFTFDAGQVLLTKGPGGWPWCVRRFNDRWRAPPLPAVKANCLEKHQCIWLFRNPNMDIVFQMWQRRIRWLFTLLSRSMRSHG